MKSIKWKLVSMYVMLVLIVMIASGTFIVSFIQKQVYADLQGRLDSAIDTLREAVAGETSKEARELALKQVINNYKYLYKDTQIYLLDEKGNTIFSTVNETVQESGFHTSAVMTAIMGEESKELDTSTEEDKQTNELVEIKGYAKPIMMDEEVQFIIYIRTSAKEMRDSLGTTKTVIVLGVLLALVLATALGFLLSNTLTEPIIALTQKAKEMAQGNLDQQITIHSNDEIGQLTENFNYMARELARTLGAISSEKNKLETVFAHMADGILAFDQKGVLIHANPAAYSMLGSKEMGEDFHSLFQSLGIEVAFQEFMEMEPEAIRQHIIPMDHRYINACFALYQDQQKTPAGVIIVLQDVTEHKKLEEMQKEFVANVSHELRTPITLIKSYAETLLDGAMEDPETANHFLNVINRESDRMSMLVQDLLELSRLDNKQIKFHMQSINLSQIIQDCTERYQIHARQKQQKMTYQPEGEDIKIVADPDRVNQVLNNILSNAIKYSPEDASITVSTREDTTNYLIKIEDTGMGIPQEDLSRVFDRFYRVDKARSRAMGGTGLGLAIAKEIMEFHGGRITISSVYGEGTAVSLWFPKKQGEMCNSNVS